MTTSSSKKRAKAKRLILAVGFIAAMLAAPILIAWQGMQAIQYKNDELHRLGQASFNLRKFEVFLREEYEAESLLAAGNAAALNRFTEAYNKSSLLLEQIRTSLNADISQEPVNRLRSLKQQSLDLINFEVVPAIAAGNTSALAATDPKFSGIQSQTDGSVVALSGWLDEQSSLSKSAASQAATETVRNVILSLVLIGLAGLGVNLLLGRRTAPSSLPARRAAAAGASTPAMPWRGLTTNNFIAPTPGSDAGIRSAAPPPAPHPDTPGAPQIGFDAIFQSLADGVIVFSPQGQLVSVNHAAENILGRKAAQLIGERQTGIAELDQAFSRESRLPGQDGNRWELELGERSYSVSVSPVLNESCLPEGKMAVLQDISAMRGQTRQQQLLYQIAGTIALGTNIGASLRQSLDLCLEAMNASSGSIMLIAANQKLWLAAHRGLPEQVTTGFHQRVGEGIAGWVAEHGEPLLLTDQTADPRFKGSKGIKDAVCIPIRDEHRTIGVLSLNERQTAEGFTEASLDFLSPVAMQLGMALTRSRLYKKIAEEKEKQATIVENIGDSLAVQDRDHRIHFANSAHKQIFGQDTTGKPCYQVYLGLKDECSQCPLDQCFTEGKTVRFAHRVLDHQGKERQLETTASPARDSNGKITGCIEVSRDVTEMNRLRNQAQSRLETLTTLFETSNALSASLDLPNILHNLSTVLLKSLSADHAAVLLLDEQRGQLTVSSQVNRVQDGPSTVGAVFDLKKCSLTDLLASPQPFTASSKKQLTLAAQYLAPADAEAVLIGRLASGGRPLGLIVLSSQQRGAFSRLGQKELFNDIANQAGMAIDNAQVHRRLEDTFLSTIRSLAEAINAKDAYTMGHSDRVADYAEALARRLKLGDKTVRAIRCAGYLHDTGKIGIPDAILLKPGRLTDQEFTMIKDHPLLSHKIIEPVNFPYDVKPIVRHHHERFDGAGYPDGLAGNQIPLGARIIGIADAFEAMTSDRPYRKALSHDIACQELKRCAGSQFDSNLVHAFLEAMND